MDLESNSLEPVAPFELLTLTESLNPPLEPLIPEISHFSPPSSTLTILPASGLISQSVHLIHTMFAAEETVVSSTEPCTPSLDVLDSSLIPFSPEPVFSPAGPPVYLESMPMFCARVRDASSSLFRLDTGRTGAEEESGEILEGFPQGSLENGNCHFPLDSIATLVSPKKLPSLHLPLPDPIPFIHRSISSPVFAATSHTHTTLILNGNSEQKAKKRKAVTSNLQLPEAEAPAVLPRFQWFQGKGLVKIHVLIKNVSPMDVKLKCNGRDLELRCSSDGCPFPPTKPLPVVREMVAYHLPLRLAHRVHADPEFIRYSPSRIEVHYRKVKPYTEWTCLWKIPTAMKASTSWADANVRDVETSSDSDEVDEEDEDEDMERPAKRFMNGGATTATENIPLPPLPEILAPLTVHDILLPQPAHFTFGLSEPEADSPALPPLALASSTERAVSAAVAIVVSEWTGPITECVASTSEEASGHGQ